MTTTTAVCPMPASVYREKLTAAVRLATVLRDIHGRCMVVVGDGMVLDVLVSSEYYCDSGMELLFVVNGRCKDETTCH